MKQYSEPEDTKLAQNLKNTTIQNYSCIIHGRLSQILLQDSTHTMSHTSANKTQYIQMPTVSMMIVRYLICHQKILRTMYPNQYGIQYLQILRMMISVDLQQFKS